MVWKQRVPAAFAADLGLVARSHTRKPATSVAFVPRDLAPSPGLQGHLKTCTHKHEANMYNVRYKNKANVHPKP